jgi:YgiT-type zinc finger domain-containing protein
MKCIICHSPDVEQQDVNEEFHVGKDIVRMVFNVLVCQNCGERYYDQATMRKFEEIESSLEKHTLPLREEGKVMVYETRGAVNYLPAS